MAEYPSESPSSQDRTRFLSIRSAPLPSAFCRPWLWWCLFPKYFFKKSVAAALSLYEQTFWLIPRKLYPEAISFSAFILFSGTGFSPAHYYTIIKEQFRETKKKDKTFSTLLQVHLFLANKCRIWNVASMTYQNRFALATLHFICACELTSSVHCVTAPYRLMYTHERFCLSGTFYLEIIEARLEKFNGTVQISMRTSIPNDT